ncbi:MAG: PIN domain-containing protein [Defluviitaleaceae bacterium]|nr:PIN domain-containing protein [Defluviitaleaceae bacterium]
MIVLIGTNVILDYVLKREPHAASAKACIDILVSRKAKIWVPVSTLTDVFYATMQSRHDTYAARVIISKLLNAFQVVAIDKSDCIRALEMDMEDFELAIIATCARKLKAAHIITRNVEGFRNSPVSAITPEEWVAVYGKE